MKIRALAVLFVGAVTALGCTETKPAAPVVDLSTATVTVDRTDGVLANGADAVKITVSVKDDKGGGFAGAEVLVVASGEGNTLSAAAPTGADGTTTATLSSTVAEVKTISVTVNGTSLAQQPTVTFIAGDAQRLVFKVEPSDAVAGAALAPSVQVAFLDAQGNVVRGATTPVTMALEGGTPGATLGGTTTVNAVDGAATFADLSVARAGSAYRLTATAAGVEGATSQEFQISVGAAERLAFTVQPADATAGDALTPAPAVAVTDASGNVVIDANVTVTLELENGNGATVMGTLSRSTANGIAAFEGLVLNRAQQGYAFKATAPGMTAVVSESFDVTAAAPAALEFSASPADLVAGVAVPGWVTVNARDAFGNLTGGANFEISVELNVPGLLQGTTTIAAPLGTAQFDTLSIQVADAGYTLTARAAGLADVTSTEFAVLPAPAQAIAFLQQPATTTAGQVLPAVELALVDAFGNVSGAGTEEVTLALGNNPGSATLLGTLAQTPVNGIFSFNDLSLERAGTAYDLVATVTNSSFAPVTSNPFDITAGPLDPMVSTVVANPNTLVLINGQTASAVTVTTTDAFGNPLANVPVTLGSNRPQDTIIPAGPVTDAQGQLSFAISSSAWGVSTFVATVDGTTQLAQSAAVTFIECIPASTRSCYTGPQGTSGVGTCSAGQETCDPTNGFWLGSCDGEVHPSIELCADSLDQDCNGIADDVTDVDGDGFTHCTGDCCEATSMGCLTPNKVNPGAFEIPNNAQNDDCDANTSDSTTAPTCSATQKFSGVVGIDLASAMDLCQTTTANPPPGQRKWGVISATQTLANGASPTGTQLIDIQSKQSAVLVDYGTNNQPRRGSTMLGLSTGMMRDVSDPGYAPPSSGTALTTQVPAPAAYLAAHGGQLQGGSNCSGTCPTGGSTAYDSVNLRLTVRVPTNAIGFTYDYRFFSAEYATYTCTVQNDFHLALLTSSAQGLPADRNIATSNGKPVSVNNANFTSCSPKACYSCPDGLSALANTGMHVSNVGGATGWTTVSAPVVPGETITLDLMVFDATDNVYDSNVLIDNFRWLF